MANKKDTRKNLPKSPMPLNLDTTELSREEKKETETWDSNKTDESKNIYKEIPNLGSKKITGDMKKRIAKVVFDIVSETPLEKELIKDKAYIISTFVEYEFDDKLDEVFALASQLVQPSRKPLEEQRIYYIWSEIYEKLETYLAKK